jgi:hypothetical protein
MYEGICATADRMARAWERHHRRQRQRLEAEAALALAASGSGSSSSGSGSSSFGSGSGSGSAKSASASSSFVLAADDLVSILAFVLVRAQSADLCAELAYMSDLACADSLLGQEGYLLTSVQVALQHVHHTAATSSRVQRAPSEDEDEEDEDNGVNDENENANENAVSGRDRIEHKAGASRSGSMDDEDGNGAKGGDDGDQVGRALTDSASSLSSVSLQPQPRVRRSRSIFDGSSVGALSLRRGASNPFAITTATTLSTSATAALSSPLTSAAFSSALGGSSSGSGGGPVSAPSTPDADAALSRPSESASLPSPPPLTLLSTASSSRPPAHHHVSAVRTTAVVATDDPLLPLPLPLPSFSSSSSSSAAPARNARRHSVATVVVARTLGSEPAPL